MVASPNMVRKGRYRAILWVRQRGRCKYCRGALSKETMTLDHVVPRAKGGRLTLSNLVLACKPCNESKGDAMPWDWDGVGT